MDDIVVSSSSIVVVRTACNINVVKLETYNDTADLILSFHDVHI